jgi:hypothetical protein
MSDLHDFSEKELEAELLERQYRRRRDEITKCIRQRIADYEAVLKREDELTPFDLEKLFHHPERVRQLGPPETPEEQAASEARATAIIEKMSRRPPGWFDRAPTGKRDDLFTTGDTERKVDPYGR